VVYPGFIHGYVTAKKSGPIALQHA